MTRLEDISSDFAISFDFAELAVDVRYDEVSFYNKEANVTVSLDNENFADVVRAFCALRGEAFLTEE